MVLGKIVDFGISVKIWENIQESTHKVTCINVRNYVGENIWARTQISKLQHKRLKYI
jgi:hypothetical protein